MKKTLQLFAMAVLAATSILFVSCDDKKPTTEDADKTALNALITECQTLADAATPALYPQTAIDDFKTVIAAAIAIKDDASATQTSVDNMVVNLTNAKTVFLESAYSNIPASALLVGLSFDEGTSSTTTLTAAGKNLTVNLNNGIIDPNERPTFIAGHNGKAVHFAGASNMSIKSFTPSDFTGAQLSISVWVNPDETKADNYFLSYNSWHTWKLQLQSENKPFFTVSTATGATDADNEAAFSVNNNTWTHVVVVLNLTAETLDFYINGELTKQWTSETKGNLKGSIVPPANDVAITIGGCYETLEAAQLNDWDGFTQENYNNYFNGALDELKIYNIALTPGQVSGLYNSESAN